MSDFAASVLQRIEAWDCPSSAIELAEDLGVDLRFDRDEAAEISLALRQLVQTGKVTRFDDPERQESPFYGLPCSQLSAGQSPIEDLYTRRSYLPYYDGLGIE
jgi:hypothetical protein